MAIRGVLKSYHGVIDLDDDSDGEVNPGLFADTPPSGAADSESEGNSASRDRPLAFVNNVNAEDNRMLTYGEGGMSTSDEEERAADMIPD
jgi:hypothetical protein